MPCVWAGAVCQPGSAGEESHIPQVVALGTRVTFPPHQLLSNASTCCNIGFSSPCISTPGLDLSRSSSLFATLMPLQFQLVCSPSALLSTD